MSLLMRFLTKVAGTDYNMLGMEVTSDSQACDGVNARKVDHIVMQGTALGTLNGCPFASRARTRGRRIVPANHTMPDRYARHDRASRPHSCRPPCPCHPPSSRWRCLCIG